MYLSRDVTAQHVAEERARLFELIVDSARDSIMVTDAETIDPPGTFVPPHIHPTQDEFIYVLENRFDLYLDGQHHVAKAGDLVRMPAGIPHGYYNISDITTRAIFWVTPGRRLRELFDVLHNMTDPMQVVMESAKREVTFLKPEDCAFDVLAMKAH